MPRARSIKPGFFTSDTVGELCSYGRLFYIGLWTVADRAGRLEERPRKLKATLLPYDECDIEKLLSDLDSAGFIIRYVVNKVKYIQIVNFEKHQNPHKHECVSTIQAPEEHHTSSVGEQYKSSLILDPLHKEEKGTKRKSDELSMDDIQKVFDHWRDVCNHPMSPLTPVRVLLIRRRGKHHSVEQMKKAITGCSVTPHNQGDNDREARYDGIELILRDAGQIERFERNADTPPRKVRNVNGAGKRYVIDGEDVLLPPNNGANDKELNGLCTRFGVKITGLSRPAAQDKLRKALEKAEAGEPV